MMRVMKTIISSILVGIMVVSNPLSFFAETTPDTKTSINDLLNTKESVILPVDVPEFDPTGAKVIINGETGQVLYSEDAEVPLPLLSVTKVLASYVIYDELNKKDPNFTLDTKIPAVGRPVLVSYEHSFSNLSLIEDQEYLVSELLESVLIHSANASTMLLGQHLFGGEKQFVDEMMKKAESLGLKQTFMVTSTGLSKSDLEYYGYDDIAEGENKMSAADIAYMTMNFIKDYPQALEISKKTEGTFGVLTSEPYEYDTTIGILPGMEDGIEGVDGLKTGADLFEYTSAIVFTAKRGDARIIGVVLGSRDAEYRTIESRDMIEYAFNVLEHKTFIDESTPLFGTGKVKMKYTLKRSVSVAVNEPFILSTSNAKLQPEVNFIPTNSKYDKKRNKFNGPIQKGEILGKLEVDYEDLQFLTGTNDKTYSVNVVATEDSGNGFFLFNAFEWIGTKIADAFSKGK